MSRTAERDANGYPLSPVDVSPTCWLYGDVAGLTVVLEGRRTDGTLVTTLQVVVPWGKIEMTKPKRALRLFHSYWGDGAVPYRVPGVDTLMRIAVSLWIGRTIEEAAAKEYLYRWSIAHNGRAFPPPHCLGR